MCNSDVKLCVIPKVLTPVPQNNFVTRAQVLHKIMVHKEISQNLLLITSQKCHCFPLFLEVIHVGHSNNCFLDGCFNSKNVICHPKAEHGIKSS